MKRRDPTRIELKLEDIQEYEQMKRDLEIMRKAKETNVEADPSKDDTETVQDSEELTAKARTEMRHRRIGYDPTPKMQ